MEAGRLIAQAIIDVDYDSITNFQIDGRTRPLAIDPYNGPGETVWRRGDPGNVPFVVNRVGEGKVAEAKDKEKNCDHCNE